jgi:hypothetical protein
MTFEFHPEARIESDEVKYGCNGMEQGKFVVEFYVG